jgi:hypothetical protein
MLNKNLFYVIIGTALIFTACKKDKNSDPDPSKSPFEVTYNDKSSDENKGTIEDNGIQLTQEMDQMKDLDAIKIAINFGKQMDQSGLPVGSSAMKAGLTPENVLIAYKNGTLTSKSASDMLKSATSDPENLLDAWNQVVGTYDYNKITDEFDKTEGGNEIVINFPGYETDLTNTAQIKVNNFNYMTVTESYTVDGEEMTDLVDQQLPTSLHSELSYTGTVLITWNLSASFQSNGMPTSFSSVLTVAPYSLGVELTHTPYSEATSTFSFKSGSDILIETHTEVSGDWTETNINNNVIIHYDVYTYQIYDWQTDSYVEVTDSNRWSEVYVENIVQNSNAYLQVLDIKVAGLVDLKAIAPEARSLDDKYENEQISEQDYAQQMVDLINSNAKLVVVSVKDNVLICKAELYVYHNEENSSYEPALKFIFGDGSSVDAETYFSSGQYENEFGDLIDQIETLVDDFDAEYGTNN